MSEGKHTPGPWEVSHETINRNGYNRLVIDGEYLHVAEIVGNATDDGDPQSTANARLIAAAPDLLAACEAIMELVEAGECSDGYAASQMRAAIAKARGQP